MSKSPPRSTLGGYARVGWSGRRGPNLLVAEGGRITLRCLRLYSFTPDQIVGIERLNGGWLDGGVRIVHSVADYPRAMAFYCHGGSDAVFALLAQSGFVPRGSGPAGRWALFTAPRLLVTMLVVGWAVSTLVRMLSKLLH